MSAQGFTYDPFDHNVTVVGSAGGGKTYFTLWLILKFLIPAGVDFVVWDYNHRGYDSLPVPKIHTYDAKTAPKQCVYQPYDKSEKAFIAFCKAVFTSNKVVIIEEAQEYFTKQHMPEEANHLIRTGRNFGVCYIAVTQRPQEMHTAVLSNSMHLFVFKLTYPPDVDLLVKWVGEELRNIKALPLHNFYYRNKYADAPIVMKAVTI